MTSRTPPDADAALERLAGLVARGGVVVLSGAGISTASGIPDYRGPTGRHRTSPPMQWDEFRASAHARRRYWARGQVGFRRYAGIRPNAAHEAVVALERAGLVEAVVTQNVDGLHAAAGSREVVELHGSLDEVVCLGCGGRRDRHELQVALDAANPWLAELDAPAQADGDAVLGEEHVRRFEVVRCDCGSDYRPDVVFFGEFVPRERMARARELAGSARTLLVLGSSLQVGSGYLLARHTLRHGGDVGIVNRGPTRADHLVDLRVDGDLVEVLPGLVRTVTATLPGVAG